MEVFDYWDVTFTEKQEDLFKKYHFDPVWTKFAKVNGLDYKDAANFIQALVYEHTNAKP